MGLYEEGLAHIGASTFTNMDSTDTSSDPVLSTLQTSAQNLEGETISPSDHVDASQAYTAAPHPTVHVDTGPAVVNQYSQAPVMPTLTYVMSGPDASSPTAPTVSPAATPTSPSSASSASSNSGNPDGAGIASKIGLGLAGGAALLGAGYWFFWRKKR